MTAADSWIHWCECSNVATYRDATGWMCENCRRLNAIHFKLEALSERQRREHMREVNARKHREWRRRHRCIVRDCDE